MAKIGNLRTRIVLSIAEDTSLHLFRDVNEALEQNLALIARLISSGSNQNIVAETNTPFSFGYWVIVYTESRTTEIYIADRKKIDRNLANEYLGTLTAKAKTGRVIAPAHIYFPNIGIQGI